MTDTSQYYGGQQAQAPRVEARVLTPEDQAAVDALYEELKPQATQAARDYVLTRTKAEWQEAMTAKIDADWPTPPVQDPAMIESRRLDRESYKRTAQGLNPQPAYPQPAYPPR